MDATITRSAKRGGRGRSFARADAPAAISGYQFRIATADDDPDLRRLLRDNPMPGEISVSLEREPDVFLAGWTEGDRHHTIVARDRASGRAVGMASRSVFSGFVNGAPCRIGYLSQLRVDRAYRGRIGLLAQGYALVRSLRGEGEAAFDLTTIVADNLTARRVLGARMPGVPRYRAVEPLTTLVVPVWRRRRIAVVNDVEIVHGARDTIPQIAACLERNRSRFQFAPRWTSEELLSPTRSRGLAPSDFLLAVRSGRVIGCLALWDQSGFKQIVVRGYGPRLDRWRRVVDLIGRVAGTPRLPAPGRPLRHVYVSHLAVDDDRPDVFRALLSAACNEALARRHTCLVIGFADRHPFLRVVRRECRAWSYSSVLYTVDWDEGATDGGAIDGRIPHLEVGLL